MSRASRRSGVVSSLSRISAVGESFVRTPTLLMKLPKNSKRPRIVRQFLNASVPREHMPRLNRSTRESSLGKSSP